MNTKLNLVQKQDDEIVQELKLKVSEESKLLVEILNLLEQVRDRKIYTDYGCSSLFDFCVKELKYSEGAAMRRINALKLQGQSAAIKELIHESLENGSLNLSHLGAVAKLDRAENFSIEQLEQAIIASQETSARETEKVIRKKLNLTPLIEKVKVTLELNAEQLLNAQRLAAQFSHALPTPDLPGLFLYLLERESRKAIERSEKMKKEPRKVELQGDSRQVQGRKVGQRQERRQERRQEPHDGKALSTSAVIQVPRSFSQQFRDQALRRAGYQCEFVSQVSRKRCESRWFLQLDHVVPWSLGGQSTLENCRVVCGAHNRAEWIRVRDSMGTGGNTREGVHLSPES